MRLGFGAVVARLVEVWGPFGIGQIQLVVFVALPMERGLEMLCSRKMDSVVSWPPVW